MNRHQSDTPNRHATSLLPLSSSLLAAALLAAQPLQAEEPLTILITASRVEQPEERTLASVTVIGRDEIERSQASDLPELIKGIAGLHVSTSGGIGKVTDLYLRGTNPNHLLLLIDGVRIGSATTGAPALHDLPLALIDRIEIVRGPRSALYGSEAIGGVIQLFTRRGEGDGSGNITVASGSNGERRATATLASRVDRHWWSIGGSRLESDGIDATLSPVEPDRDAYTNRSIQLAAGTSWAAGELSLQLLRAEAESEYDNLWDPRAERSDSLNQTAGITLKLNPHDNLDLTFRLGEGRDELDNLADNQRDGWFNTRRRTISIQSDWRLTDDRLLTIGGDRQQERVDSSTRFLQTGRDSSALFARYDFSHRSDQWQLALRHDESDQYGGATTGHIAWGRDLSRQLRMKASFGSAFKAPDFNTLYWPDNGFGGGNPQLSPERSRSAELSLVGSGSIDWQATLFATRVDQLISGWPPTNVNEARIIGLEGQIEWQPAPQWRLSLDTTLQRPEAYGGFQHGHQLPRRPRQQATLSLHHDSGRLDWGATLHAEGRRYDELTNQVSMAGYATLGLNARYKIDHSLSLELKGSNLLDRDYETAAGYRQPGRGILLSINYQFELPAR